MQLYTELKNLVFDCELSQTIRRSLVKAFTELAEVSSIPLLQLQLKTYRSTTGKVFIIKIAAKNRNMIK